MRRTRDRLALAIRELIQQKSLRTITVQDVLEKAHVSRSAFYAHFANTRDLFVTDLDEFLESTATHLSRGRDKSDRVAPVHEFFEHALQAEGMRAALARSGQISDFLELARHHFARGIGQRLNENPRSQKLAKMECTLLAQGLAGALVAQFEWWLQFHKKVSAREIDRRFHRLVWASVAAALHAQRSETQSGGKVVPKTKSAIQADHRRSR